MGAGFIGIVRWSLYQYAVGLALVYEFKTFTGSGYSAIGRNLSVFDAGSHNWFDAQ